MARSKADISNTAIRMFLQDVGKFYDELRELTPYRGTSSQKQEILSFFDGLCCYCGVGIGLQTMNQDHLIPMNRVSLGLHAWGNVVPSCAGCNSKKQHKSWESYLAECCSEELKYEAERKANIIRFMEHYQYEPNLELEDVAYNLYQDVGEVSKTLIDLRLGQAERLLRTLHDQRGAGEENEAS